jgi:hypothetical protein
MRLIRPCFTFFIAFSTLAFASSARADILISINKSAQQMTVKVDGYPRYVWPVSTGAPGYDTPSGRFKPFRMERDHFSREWDDAPMPHSIFFTQQGHAIHGSGHIKAIGTPASHGCVRLEPTNASILFALVKQEGMSRTHVVLTGETPSANELVVRRGWGSYGVRVGEETTAVAPVRRQRTAPGSREYRDDTRPDYYRTEPFYERRYYRPRGYFPFGW